MRVDDVAWSERPTLFGAAPTERAYTLDDRRAGPRFRRVRRRRARRAAAERREQRARHLSQGPRASTAMSPPTSLTQLMTRPLGLKSVSNPLAGRGRHRSRAGRAQARQTMPLDDAHARAARCRCSTTRTSRAPSAASPRRRRRCCSCRPGRRSRSPRRRRTARRSPPASPVWSNLLAALKASGDPHVAVTLLAHQASTFRLGLKVKRDPAYEAEHGARRGRGGAARALRLRRARRSASRCSSRTSSPSRRRCPASSRSTSTRLYGGTQPPAQTLAVAAGRGCWPRACASRRGVAAAGRAADARSRAVRPAGGDGMSRSTAERLYALLPAVYRMRDARAGRAAARAGRR